VDRQTIESPLKTIELDDLKPRVDINTHSHNSHQHKFKSAMIATTAPVSDTKQQQHSSIVHRGAPHAKKYK
jgi:hypothetical protein